MENAKWGKRISYTWHKCQSVITDERDPDISLNRLRLCCLRMILNLNNPKCVCSHLTQCSSWLSFLSLSHIHARPFLLQFYANLAGVLSFSSFNEPLRFSYIQNMYCVRFFFHIIDSFYPKQKGFLQILVTVFFCARNPYKVRLKLLFY